MRACVHACVCVCVEGGRLKVNNCKNFKITLQIGDSIDSTVMLWLVHGAEMAVLCSCPWSCTDSNVMCLSMKLCWQLCHVLVHRSALAIQS